MSELEPASTIEAKVGATRHDTLHIARAVSAEQRIYLLHPHTCVADCARRGVTLQACDFSQAMDVGIAMDIWAASEDQPVIVHIDTLAGDLIPCPDTDADADARKDQQ